MTAAKESRMEVFQRNRLKEQGSTGFAEPDLNVMAAEKYVTGVKQWRPWRIGVHECLTSHPPNGGMA